MSGEYEIKFQYVNPSNIESEVPGEQKIREVNFSAENPTTDQVLLEYDEGIQVVEESSLVPVITVTKQEAEFTKGDIKLQKVSVNENISEKENVLIRGEVMESQPVRAVPGHQDSADSSKEDKDQAEPKKLKTRIPKFKQTVEKVNKEKKDTDEKKEEEIPPTQELRSSIPKLSKNSKIPTGKETNVKNDAKLATSNKNDNKEVPAQKAKIKTASRGIPLPVKDKYIKKPIDATPPVKKDTDITPAVVNKSIEEIHHEENKVTDINLTLNKKAGDEFDKIYDEPENTTDTTLSVKTITDITPPIVNNSNKEILPDEIYAEDINLSGDNKTDDEFNKIYDEKEKSEDITDAITIPPIVNNFNEVLVEETISSDKVVTEDNKADDDFDKIYDEQAMIQEEITDARPSIEKNVDITPFFVNKSNDDIPSEETDSADINITEVNEAESEFDKIYDEIFDTKAPEVANDENSTFDDLEDPEKLDMKFEDIMHAYDDYEVQPIVPVKVNTRNPLVKQKSMHEVEIPKQALRRLSLEDASNDGSDVFHNRATELRNEKHLVDAYDTNINRIEEYDIEQHSMIYTIPVQDKAQFEIMAQLPEKEEEINDTQVKDINNIQEPLKQLEEIHNIPTPQEPATRTQDTNDSNINTMEEQNIEQHSIIYTNEPAQFEITTSEKKDDDDTQLEEIHNIPTPQEPAMRIQDTNDSNIKTMEEQNIEQHSMIYTNEPAQFEITTAEKKDDDATQLGDIHNIPTPHDPAMRIPETSNSNIKTIEEQNIEQHSMIYTNEPAQFEITTSEKKDDDDTQLEEIHNIPTPQEPAMRIQDTNDSNIKTMEEQNIEQHSMIYTNEPAQFEITTAEKKDDDATQFEKIHNIPTPQEPAMRIQDTNDSNIKTMEEQNIEQHSMIYTNEPAQFEITTSEKKHDDDTQLEEIYNIPTPQEPTMRIQDTNDSNINTMEEQNIEQHSMIYTNEPAQFEITTAEKKDDDATQLGDTHNIPTPQEPAMRIQDTNNSNINTMEEQNIEQHSMIYTNESAQFEITRSEKEDDDATKLEQIHNIQTPQEPAMRIQDTNDSNIKTMEEQNIEQHSMIYTNEPAQFEITTAEKKDDDATQFEKIHNIPTPQEPAMRIQDTNDSNIKTMEEQNIEQHSMIYTNEPAQFEITTSEKKHDDDTQLEEIYNIPTPQEPTMRIQDTNDSNINTMEEQNIEQHSMIYTNEPAQFEITTAEKKDDDATQLGDTHNIPTPQEPAMRIQDTNNSNINTMEEQNIEQHSMIYTNESAQFEITRSEKEDDDATKLEQIHNIQTPQEPAMRIQDTNDSNIKTMEEQNIEQHSMIYTNEPAQFEITTAEKKDDDATQFEKIHNIPTPQEPAMRIQDTNDSNIKTMEEQNIEQHSMIYTNEPAQFEITTSEKKHDDDTQLEEIYNIPTPQEPTMRIQDTNDSNINTMEEQNIEQHSMIYTNEPAQFEITTSEKKHDDDTQLEEIYNIPTPQEPTMRIQDTNDSNINTMEEQNIEQHSMIYTNEPAQFEITTAEKEDDDATQLGDIHNIPTPQEPAMRIQDTNDSNIKTMEEQNIEQHSMIYTNEPAQFEITTSEKKHDDDTQLEEIRNIPTPQAPTMTTQDTNDSNINTMEEQNIEQHSMIYTNEPAQLEITTAEKEHDDATQFEEIHNIPTPQEPTTRIQDTNDSNINTIEEQNIEQHSMIYTNEPAQFEITTAEKEDGDATQLGDIHNIPTPHDPAMRIPETSNSNIKTIEEQNIEQHSMTYTNEPAQFEITTSEKEDDDATQLEEIYNIPKHQEPAMRIQDTNDNIRVHDDTTETKYTGHNKPKLENQKSNSEVPDSSQLVLNIMSLIRNNQNNDTSYLDATKDSSEKEVPFAQDNDNSNKIRNEINDNEKDKDLKKSLPVQEHTNVINVQTLQKDPPIEISKKTTIKSKIAIVAGDKGTSQKDKASKPLAKTNQHGQTTTKTVHRNVQPETKTRLKGPVAHKSEQSRKKSLETDNIKHSESIKHQHHSRHKSKNDTNIEPVDLKSERSELKILPQVPHDDDNSNDKLIDLGRDHNINEETSIKKGKVSRIISRLGSQDESKETPKKSPVDEIPKKKSVSSRIAMFEDIKIQSPISKPASKLTQDTISPKPIKETNSSRESVRKPKVIDQVIKQQAYENLEPKFDEAKVEIIRNEAIFTAGKTVGEEFGESLTEDNVFEEKPIENKNQLVNIKDNKDKTKRTVEVEKPMKSKQFESLTLENEIAQTTRNLSLKLERENKDSSNKTTEMPSIGSILQRMRSTNEQSNMRRTKSVAELDLGDTVKGRVHQMIVRINSMENLLDVDRKEIDSRERPRKRSVSDKIALFERKLTPVNMDGATESNTDSRVKKNVLTTQETISEETYRERVAELKNAKIKYGRQDNVVRIALRDGVKMPALAVGTALLNSRLIPHVISAALDLGYRAIDTAFIYGNEREVGEAIRAKINEGTITREELFITSKLWSTFHRQELVEPACRASLAAMGLDYFDLYLIHNPMSFKEGGDPVPKIANVLQYSESDYMDAWYGMERLVAKGLVKSIGVSNFNSAQLSRVYEKGRVKPVVNQVECHPYLNQQRLEQSCSEREVRLSCFGVLGSKGTPRDLKSNQSPVIDDPLVKVMAAALKVTPAQLLVRYQIENGHSVVVKSSTAAHLWDNLQAMSFNVSSTEMDALNALNRNKRTYTFKGMGDTHRHYPFKAPY